MVSELNEKDKITEVILRLDGLKLSPCCDSMYPGSDGTMRCSKIFSNKILRSKLYDYIYIKPCTNHIQAYCNSPYFEEVKC